jgi:hypothetical protein
LADLSDVTAYLANAAYNAVYPKGTLQPSVAAMDVRVFEGWPTGDQLDLDLTGEKLQGSPPLPVARSGGPLANVSVYPMPGTGVSVYQIQDATYTIVPVSYGMGVSVNGNTLTVTGQPNTGEYLSLICDGAFIYSRTGATRAALLASLATDAQVNYPSAASTATSLTVPANISMVVRQGGVATLGKVVHRQKQAIMVTVWAPTTAARATLASAIDVALKQTNKITMPDTSQALLVYSRTNVTDDLQSATIYRRDLIYDAEYATLQTFPGYVVTSVTTTIANPTNTAIATAIGAGITSVNPPIAGSAPSLKFNDPVDSQYLPLV